MKKSFILTILCLFAILSANAQVDNLYVSPTGWAMWDKSDNVSSYQIYLNGELEADNITDLFYQHENLVDDQEYTTKVVPVYSNGNGEAAEYSWKKQNCDLYAGAYNLTAGIVNNVGFVSWTLPAIYKNEKTSEGNWLHYDNGTYAERIGLTFDGTSFEPFKWAIMLPASDMAQYAGQKITKVSFYDAEAFDGEVEIYEGGSTEPGTLLYSQEFSGNGSNDFKEIALNEAVEISGNKNVWLVFCNLNGNQPAAGCADQNNPNGRFIYHQDYGWLDLMYVSYPAYTWMIRAYVEEQEVPVINEVIGAILYRNGELISPLVTDEHYIDIQAKAGDEYTLRVVYAGQKDMLHYFMACPQTAKIDNVAISENSDNVICIYPNPTKTYLNIEAENMTHISIANTLGQIVFDKEVGSDMETIDMTQYNSGVFFVRITTENGVVVKRVSLEK